MCFFYDKLNLIYNCTLVVMAMHGNAPIHKYCAFYMRFCNTMPKISVLHNSTKKPETG